MCVSMRKRVKVLERWGGHIYKGQSIFTDVGACKMLMKLKLKIDMRLIDVELKSIKGVPSIIQMIPNKQTLVRKCKIVPRLLFSQ